MNNLDIAKILASGIHSGKELPVILEDVGISIDYKSDEGASIVEISLDPILQKIISPKVLREILYGFLSISPSLGINSIAGFVRVISGLFINLDDSSLLSTVISSLIQVKIFDPNIIIDDQLLLEYLAARRDKINDAYDTITRTILLHPDFNAFALSIDSKSIGEKLFNIDIKLFLDLVSVEPRAADFWMYGETSRLSGIVKKLQDSNCRPKELISLLDVIPGVLYDVSFELGAFRFFAFVAPVMEGNFSAIPEVVSKLFDFQAEKKAFIKGLIKYFVVCKDVLGVNESLQSAFIDVLNIITISRIMTSLNKLEVRERTKESLLRKFVKLLPLFVHSLGVLSWPNRQIMIELMEMDIDNLELIWEQSEQINTKQLSLFLKLKGHSSILGDLEKGCPEHAAFYMNSLLGHILHSSTEADEYLKNIKVGLYRAIYFSSCLLKNKYLKYLWNKLTITQLLLHYAQSEGVLILTGWKSHVVTLWVKGRYLFRCNGGSCSFDSTVEVYEITKIGSLTPGLINTLYMGRGREKNKILLQQRLHNILGLKLITKCKGIFQVTGNCSLHSIQLGILAIIATSISHKITVEVLDAAAIKLVELMTDLRVIGIRQQVAIDVEHAKILISHGMSIIDGSRTLEDQQLYQYVLRTGLCPVDESMIILQMYSHLLLQSTGIAGKIRKYEDFLSSVGLFPFVDNKVLGKNGAIFLKMSFPDKDEIEISDIDIFEFHQEVKDFTLLHIAVITNNKLLVKRLIKKQPELLEQKDMNNITPIGYIKDLDLLRLLLSYGASIDWGSSYKETILDRMSAWANYELIERALIAGAKVEPNSLILAAANPDIRVQRLLLDTVTSIDNVTSKSKRTALHSVASKGTVEHLNYLLSVDVIRSAQVDINGMTPLWFAVMARRIDTAFALCRHPQATVSKPYRGDNFGEVIRAKLGTDTQVDEIERMRKEKIEDLTYFRDRFMRKEKFVFIQESAMITPIDWFVLTVNENDLRAFRGALLCYPELNISMYSRTFASTALHRALEEHISTEFISILLRLPGIDLECINGAGETLAQVAAMNDNVEILKILHSLGAPMNKPDTVGVTPLMDAADRGCTDAVEYLLSIQGLDSSYRNYMGINALDMAKASRNYETRIHKMLEGKSQQDSHISEDSRIVSQRISLRIGM